MGPEDSTSFILSFFLRTRECEIFGVFSDNRGATWSDPINISNTYSPGCEAGSCLSELDPSLAKKVTDNLYIFFIEDRDPGSVIHSCGEKVACPVKVAEVPVRALSMKETTLIRR
jgi:hypothetical protein